jgi:hypothetical protein
MTPSWLRRAPVWKSADMTNLSVLTDLGVLERNWDRAPFVARGLGDLSGVFSVRIVEDLLAAGTFPEGSLRLYAGGHAVAGQEYTRARERQGRQRDRLVDADAVARAVAGGATMVVEELETYCPGVRALAAALRELTGFSTYCAGFVTPSDTPGLTAHFDLTSVLIRQVHGSKRWRVSMPLRALPEREWSAQEAPAGEPVLDVVLAAGDCLYVPRGYFHAGEATEHGSVHLSVAIKPTTWKDLLAKVISTDPGLPLRESVPFGFHRIPDAEMVAGLRTQMQRVLAGIEDEDDAGGAAARAAVAPVRRAAAPVRTGGALADVLDPSRSDLADLDRGAAQAVTAS